MDNLTSEQLNETYRALAEAYLIGKYGIMQLNSKFAEFSPRFVPASWRQSPGADPDAADYIWLLNQAHTDRLSEEELEFFEDNLNSEADPEVLSDFVELTYRKVLAGTLTPGAMHEYYRDIHGRGMLPGRAIIFVFSDEPEYDDEGEANEENEALKDYTFNEIREQFEEIAAELDGDEVLLIRL